VSQPLVTVVTPSFNQGAFIRATIESVLAQDYPHLEYIVVDGASTDQTASVVRDYSSRLTWISEKDRGQAHAINKGFRCAQGQVVAWLNSDDLLLPGAIGSAVHALAEAGRVGAVYGEGYLMDEQGRRTGRFSATESFNLWKLTYLSDYVLQQSTFFRRTAIEAVGLLDETLHYALDWDLLIKIGNRFGLQFVPQYWGVLREHPAAKTFSGGWKRVDEIRRVLERHTGMRRAPGFWTYGLDTAQKAWHARCRAWALGSPFLASAAHLPVYVPTAVALMLIIRHAQGLYPDGWASDRLKWRLPGGGGAIMVRGRAPIQRRSRGLVLTMVAGGRVLAHREVAPGEFAFSFEAPHHDGPFEFEIHASAYRRANPLSDRSVRRMAWIPAFIEWVHDAPGYAGRPVESRPTSRDAVR
jgi:hypothetical protein